MLIVFLIIISYVLVILNFGAPVLVSNTPDMVLLLEHTGVLASCFMIIDRVLKGCESKHRYNICFFSELLYLSVNYESDMGATACQ